MDLALQGLPLGRQHFPLLEGLLNLVLVEVLASSQETPLPHRAQVVPSVDQTHNDFFGAHQPSARDNEGHLHSELFLEGRCLRVLEGFLQFRLAEGPLIELQKILEILEIAHVEGLGEEGVDIYGLVEHDGAERLADAVLAGEAGVVVEVVDDLVRFQGVEVDVVHLGRPLQVVEER